MKEKIKQFLMKNNCIKVICFFRYLKRVPHNIMRFFKNISLSLRKIICYLQRPGVIRKYFDSHKVHKLQIGGGRNILRGWLNTDLIPTCAETIIFDVTKPFCFEDETFDYIFCEHMIEHLSYNAGLQMLKECFRVLKKDGKIRISTPDLQVYLDCFNDDRSQIQKQYLDWLGNNWLKRAGIDEYTEVFALNLVMHGWGHMFVYDYKTLVGAVANAGFARIIKVSAKSSDDENLNNIEMHGDSIKNIKSIEKPFGSAIDNKMNEFSSLTIEALK